MIVVCVAVLAGYAAAALFNRTSAGQAAAPVKAGQDGQPVLRYQLTAYGNGLGPTPTCVAERRAGGCERHWAVGITAERLTPRKG